MRIVKLNSCEIQFQIRDDIKPEPILWCRQGIFCIIPKQIIENIIDNLEMYQKISSKTIHPIVRITWDQGIPVDPKVGYALMGE